MNRARILIGLIFLALSSPLLIGCHKDPELGPTNPTPPPPDMKGGKLGTPLQGGMPGTAAPGGPAQQPK